MLESFSERVEESAAYTGAREWVTKRLPSAAAFSIKSNVVRMVAVMHTCRKNSVARDGKY
jgi:hypothetical protein